MRRFATVALLATLWACGGIDLPDGDGDGIPDLIDPCPTNPDPTCIPDDGGTPEGPYDCENPPALTGLVKVVKPILSKYIVVLKPTRAVLGPSEIVAFARRYPGVSAVQPLTRAFSARIEDEALAKLLKDASVQYVQQEGTKHTVALSWGLDRVDQRSRPLDGSFTPDGDGAGVDIYINDTGVTGTADLGDRLSADCFSTIVFRGCEDGHGHGTHVAGTAAGTTWGVAKKAIVHSARFLDENGSGTDTDAIRTLDWIAQHAGGGVVNASWGGSPAPAVDEAVCRVIASGKVFVAAAGNESADAYTSTPARVLQVVTVGASDREDQQAYFSNFGAGLDLYAPGVDIESDTPAGGTAVYSGTSMATPHVVGAAAILRAKHPGESPAQVRDRLVAEATKDALDGTGPGSPNLLLYTSPKVPEPPPEQCPEQCPPGQHCTDPKVGCVADPVPPPTSHCPKPLAPGATLTLNNKAYGHGFDSTLWVHGDPELCQIIHGQPVRDCHLEGWPERTACEMELMKGCPIWQYTLDNKAAFRCLQPDHPVASCDHWGTAGGAQDDPKTPAYEGMPVECGSQRVDGFPAAGFYTVAHGKAQIRACLPDATGCGPWRKFDRALSAPRGNQ